MQFLPLFLLAAHAVQAVQLDWYLNPSCNGEHLYGVVYNSFTDCTTPDAATTNAQSLVVAFNTPLDTGYEVHLFSDTSCNTLYEVQDESVCVADEDGQVKAYQVVAVPISRIATSDVAKRSPRSIQRGIESMLANSGHDIAVRDSNVDLAPPKHYDVGFHNVTGPHVLLNQDHPYLSAAVSSVVTAVSFSSLVTGCIGVGSAAPIAQFSCAASIATTGISFLATLYHAYQGYRSIRATLRNNNIEIGVRRPRARGLGGDETMTLSHEEYMEYILQQVGLEGKHIGYTQRDEDLDWKTPAYQFSGSGGQDFVFTISGDDNGEVKHSISFAHDAQIQKRQGYEGVTVNGGLDIEACQRSAGDQGDLPYSASSAYSYFYDDLTCLVSSSELLNSNYLQADVLDKSGATVLTIGMAPYKSGQANKATAKPYCDNTKFYFSQTCVN